MGKGVGMIGWIARVFAHSPLARLFAFAVLACAAGLAAAQPKAPLRFGVLPVGDVVESRRNWEPLWADVGKQVGVSVVPLSVSTYDALAQAIQRREVDIAYLPGKMALDAVSGGQMKVIAQVHRREGPSQHQAVLITRKDSPLSGLDKLLAMPDQWVMARGPNQSVSGYVVPQTQLFLPNGIDMETRFRDVIVGTHQETALAVANGVADVATNNTTDLERFGRQFPAEAERLQVIWHSQSTPAAEILVRSDMPASMQRKLRNALTAYGRQDGQRGERQREVLRALQSSYGYVAADNSALQGAAQLEYEMARQRALSAQWTSDAAKGARLDRIEKDHARLTAMLQSQAERPAAR
ncbi:MAG: phosphate/phosphite/phosphonate ABC transporter substrate-binding protein [Proteobacteria bacterium]|nr:phosphate/phosphite/phosphonate ABC transporter substrate-binding protein [Pseudomonadota bacterium]